MPAPAIGRVVKDFKAPVTGTTTFHLKSLRGTNVVLYFYPKDATPGCTKEGLAFNELLARFKRANTVIYGVSKDSLASHDKFRDKQGYRFDLISDEDGRVCEAFDVIKEKNMYGRKFMGIERSTFLIDVNGKLAAEWRKVKVAGHAEAVLAAAKALPKA
ncbi:MAG: peroxiredoxin [Pseudomonadota bacterium]